MNKPNYFLNYVQGVSLILLVCLSQSCEGKPQQIAPISAQSTLSDTLAAARFQLTDTTSGDELVLSFGSCNKVDAPQDIWAAVVAHQSAAWLWLGDIIYADTENMTEMRAMYDLQKQHEAYQRLRKQTKIFGIWDDHDYGANDGGKEYPQKAAARALLFEFLDYPKADSAAAEGAYHSVEINKNGAVVKVLFLDTRYFRDGLEPNLLGGSRYLINPTGDVLGEKQWKWLERELTNSTATMHLICSSIQLIPEEHGFEKWANFPTARQRFFELLEKTKPQNVLILSGDRHVAEVSKLNLKDGTPIFEVTSSGLTHAYADADAQTEPNAFRISALINQRNFGILNLDLNKNQYRVEIRGVENKLLLQTNLIYPLVQH